MCAFAGHRRPVWPGPSADRRTGACSLRGDRPRWGMGLPGTTRFIDLPGRPFGAAASFRANARARAQCAGRAERTDGPQGGAVAADKSAAHGERGSGRPRSGEAVRPDRIACRVERARGGRGPDASPPTATAESTPGTGAVSTSIVQEAPIRESCKRGGGRRATPPRHRCLWRVRKGMQMRDPRAANRVRSAHGDRGVSGRGGHGRSMASFDALAPVGFEPTTTPIMSRAGNRSGAGENADVAAARSAGAARSPVGEGSGAPDRLPVDPLLARIVEAWPALLPPEREALGLMAAGALARRGVHRE